MYPVINHCCSLRECDHFYSFIAAAITNRSFETTLGLYVTWKSMRAPGGGDLLLALLGPLTLTYIRFHSFPSISARSIIKHHAAELGAVVPLAAIFSILITIIGGRALSLHEFLTRSVAARSKHHISLRNSRHNRNWRG